MAQMPMGQVTRYPNVAKNPRLSKKNDPDPYPKNPIPEIILRLNIAPTDPLVLDRFILGSQLHRPLVKPESLKRTVAAA